MFPREHLDAIEAGRIDVSDETTSTLLDLYQVERSYVDPGDELVIDLIDEQIRIGEWSLAIESMAVEDVLDQYVNLVMLVRDHPSNENVGLRTDDVEILARELLVEPLEVLARLRVRLRSEPTSSRLALLAPMLASALLTALVVGGAFMLLSPTAASPTPAAGTAGERTEDSVSPIIAPAIGGLAPLDRNATGAAAVPTNPVVTAQIADERAAIELDGRAQTIEELVPWDFRMALPGWTIIHASPHPEWRGVTNSVERTVTLFDRPDDTPATAAGVLVHELGHAVDLQVLDNADRAAWLELRGFDGPWWARDGQVDFAVGAGDFAEAVASLLLGTEGRSPHGPYTAEQLAFVDRVLPRS